MKRVLLGFFIPVYFFSRIPFLRAFPVYYDSFEYAEFAREVTLNNFRQLILATHQPIHSFYLLTIFFLKQILPLSPTLIPVLISFLSGLGVLLIFCLWVNEVSDRQTAFRAGIYLLAFPYFFVTNTNILYESPLLFFQLVSLYLVYRGVKENKLLLILISALAFCIGVSVFIGSLLYSGLIIYLILFSKNKNKKRFLFIFSSIFIFYLISELLIFGNIKSLSIKYLSHWTDITSIADGGLIFISRILRNIFFQSLANLSVTGGIIFWGVLILNFYRDKKIRPGVIITGIILAVLMQYWHAGLYGRLSIFIIFPASYLMAKSFKSVKITLLIILLISATTFHYALYSASKPPVYDYGQAVKDNRKNSHLAIITSDYNRFLFEKYTVPIFVFRDRKGIFEDLKEFIDKNLDRSFKVIIDLPAITYPYRQFDGDFYHILPSIRNFRKETADLLDNYELFLWRYDNKHGVAVFEIKRSSKSNNLLLENFNQGKYYFPERQAFNLDPLVFLIRFTGSLIDFKRR